jgi:hypothetical protein
VPNVVSQFGKVKEHIKLEFTTGRGPIEAIAFFAEPTDFKVVPVTGTPITLLAHVEDAFFMGRRQVRLRIVDIQ